MNMYSILSLQIEPGLGPRPSTGVESPVISTLTTGEGRGTGEPLPVDPLGTRLQQAHDLGVRVETWSAAGGALMPGASVSDGAPAFLGLGRAARTARS